MRIFLLFPFLVYFLNAKAQEVQLLDLGKSFLDIEVQGGVTINNLHSGDFKKLDLGNLKQKIGYSYGVGFTFHFTKLVSLRNEFNLDSKGVLMSLRSTLDTLNQQAQEYMNIRQQLDYMTLPLMFQFKLGKKRLRFYADVGTYLGMLWNAREEIKNTLTNDKMITQNTLAFTQIDWGLLGDVGAMYHINKRLSLNLKVRYNHGFQNIETGTPVYENAKNGSWAILTALTFKF